MTTTSNHGWDIPTVGGDEDVWGEILNDFFNDELDRQVTLEGPFSERPDAATGNVKYYHATDRRIVYYNDGSSWEAVYGLGTDSNPVPGTSHFEAVDTEQLTINGQQSDDHWEEEETNTDSASNDLTVEFDNLDVNKEYKIEYAATTRQKVELEINNLTNEDYMYEDQSGTLQENQDAFLLFDGGDDNIGISGEVKVFPYRDERSMTIRNSVGFSGVGPADVGRNGGTHDVSESLDSITIEIENTWQEDQYITLYSRGAAGQ